MSARLIASGFGLFFAISTAILNLAQAADSVTPAMPLATGQPRVDEAALRYYASLKQNARVEAETLRLRRLHPHWSPPADLWTAKPGNPDDAPLWDLFAADKFDELRAAIAARRARDPNWSLSIDLEQKLRRKDDRAALLGFAKARRWTDVVEVAPAWMAGGDTTDVEVFWQIAEGFARARRIDDAQQLLDGILRTSSNPLERVATIQKALALLPMSNVERLIDSGQRDASGHGEFDGIAIDITRARISAWLHDEPGKAITDTELAAFQEYAATAADPNQTALLAWYALKRANTAEALEQFKLAIAKGGDATVAHGLAQTLKKLRQLREAEEVAYAWREPSVSNEILFIDILADQLTQDAVSIDAKRLTRYAEVTIQTSSGEGAQAIAWYAYNACQLDAAAEWFKRAVAWMPKETTVFGYALTLRRLKKTQDYIDIVNRYDGLFPKVVALMYPVEPQQTFDPCNRNASQPTQASIGPTSQRLQPLSRSIVPLPSLIGRNVIQDFAGPKRTEFPVAVSPENPYRSPASDRASGGKTVSGPWRPTPAIAFPLEAHRVFGVGSMPYERHGKGPLPGFNGLSLPSLSQELALQSPRGTLWSDERAGHEASTTRAVSSASSSPQTLAGASASARFHP